MRVLIMTLLVLFNFVLQTTLFKYIEIFGVIPDTMIILVVCYAVLRGDIEGSIFGFFAGLLVDLTYPQHIGFFALQGALVGYFCGKVYRDFYQENYLIPLLLTFAAMIFCGLTFYILNFLLLARTEFFRYVYLIIIPETIYTMVLALPLYRLLYSINRRVEKFEERRTR